jgi:hypothetical protein
MTFEKLKIMPRLMPRYYYVRVKIEQDYFRDEQH